LAQVHRVRSFRQAREAEVGGQVVAVALFAVRRLTYPIRDGRVRLSRDEGCHRGARGLDMTERSVTCSQMEERRGRAESAQPFESSDRILILTRSEVNHAELVRIELGMGR